MVGTARSRGCITCIRRKVRCGRSKPAKIILQTLNRRIDETKPYCNRCNTARITCEGYNRDPRWVDERPRLERAYVRGQSSAPSSAVGLAQSSSVQPPIIHPDIPISTSRIPSLNPSCIASEDVGLTSLVSLRF
jgi:hypothetical protein